MHFKTRLLCFNCILSALVSEVHLPAAVWKYSINWFHHLHQIDYRIKHIEGKHVKFYESSKQ